MISNPTPDCRINYNTLLGKVDDAVTQYINGRYPYLPPLSWTLKPEHTLSGLIPEWQYDEPEMIAQMWRTALGLDEGTDEPGIRAYTVTEPMKIEVWYITDRTVFES